LLKVANAHPDLVRVRANGMNDTPEYRLNFDLRKAAAMGIPAGAITETVSTFWGSSYINNFIDRGRVKKVYMQADSQFRMQPDDYSKLYVRSGRGDMIPFSTFTTGSWGYASPRLERYDGVSSLEIMGEAAPGKSSGHAMDVMEELARDLPSGFGFSWTGLSFQERMTGAQAPALYAISLIVVFLCLAALYESWSIPFSVMLVVPLGVIGALGGAALRGMNNDVYFQVGLLTIIGLSAKNAILIVEFAKEMEESGMDLIHAILEAVRLRLRPILMTSFAFILGVIPLAISTGPGSGSQNAIGTGVVCGMLTATVLGIFYIPLAFVVVSRLFKVRIRTRDGAVPAPAAALPEGGGGAGEKGDK
jgi:hydrophobe/amphiphile efflux-1 (HAE1) family protein